MAAPSLTIASDGKSSGTETNRESASSLTPVGGLIKEIAREKIGKYPPDSVVTKLSSTFEIKQRWLFSEWDPVCQFSKFILPHFPQRRDLDPANPNPNQELIESTFDAVRGKWTLWQEPREKGRWKKVSVAALKIEWVMENVTVRYASTDRFPVAELNGIVLWEDKSKKEKRYELYEGNHRISAWLAAQTPKTLPALIFIGKPKKPLDHNNS